MELRRLFTEGSDGFDELDRFLLRAIVDRAHGREPEEPPYARDVLFERADIAVTLRSGGWSDAVVTAAVDRYPFIRTPVEETLRFLRTELGVESATSTSYA
ncbi:hypothetical protein [Streptomyces avermitilis]|uniref:hypothetical protein n=1 Tax=Streptomyces avermitilis TaxID=33903 RepID=UPI0037F762F7